MRKPASLVPWLSEVELQEWVRDSSTAAEQTRRLVIWLTHFGKWHAAEIADMVAVSVQAVWKWVGEYNKRGPSGLSRQGRGGRRWSYLTEEQEEELLRSIKDRALEGDVLTAKQVLPLVRKAAGCDVSLAYVYKLLHRHGWRKLGPRPHHVKGDANAREEFKKNSRN